MDQDLRAARWFGVWFRDSSEATIKVLARLWSSKAQAREDWLPVSPAMVRISSSGRWTEDLSSLLAIARDMRPLLCGPLLRAISNRAPCWAPGLYDTERGPERKKSQSFCNLISEAISHHFAILFVRSKSPGHAHPLRGGEITHRTWLPGGRDHSAEPAMTDKSAPRWGRAGDLSLSLSHPCRKNSGSL